MTSLSAPLSLELLEAAPLVSGASPPPDLSSARFGDIKSDGELA